MWPWGHAALGYVLFSFLVRSRPGWRVTDGPVLVLAVTTQVPDLVDKTLSWGFGYVATGYAVGHSVLVAVPVGVAAFACLAILADRPAYGVAVVAGWWSHLLGDVLFAVVTDQQYTVERVLWPLVRLEGSHAGRGILGRIALYLHRSADVFLQGDSPLVATLMVGTPLAALFLWIDDGKPVLSGFREWLATSLG